MPLTARTRLYLLVAWVTHNRRLVLKIALGLVLARFGYINWFNWFHGNTGAAGIQYYVDSYRYFDGADQLLSGKAFGHKQAEYFGYIGLIAIIKWAQLPLVTLVMLQLVVALVSSFFLFKISKDITNSSWAGIIAAALYLDNPFINVWHLYILTESLYTSMLIIATWSIYKACKDKTVKTYFVAVGMVAATAVIRPNGWILLPLTAIWFVLSSKYKPTIKWASCLGAITMFLLCVAFLPASNRVIQKVERNVTMNDLLINGVVVWGHDEVNLQMPQDSAIKNENWTLAYAYIAKHPLASARLAFSRVASELLEINRPWYTTRYKIWLFLWLWPAYLFAVIGIIRYWRIRIIKILVTVIAAHLLIIALTYAEHEHRFLNYILPLVYAISAAGIYCTLKWLARKLKPLSR